MGVFVNTSNFSVGRNAIPSNKYSVTDLASYIVSVEESTIYRIFGVTMGELLFDTPTLYPEITDPFIEEINGELIESKGISFILEGIIFFLWSRDQYVKLGNKSVSRKLNENATNDEASSFDIFTRYNNAIDSIKAIQYKCESDSATYPDYKGTNFTYVLPI